MLNKWGTNTTVTGEFQQIPRKYFQMDKTHQNMFNKWETTWSQVDFLKKIEKQSQPSHKNFLGFQKPVSDRLMQIASLLGILHMLKNSGYSGLARSLYDF